MCNEMNFHKKNKTSLNNTKLSKKVSIFSASLYFINSIFFPTKSLDKGWNPTYHRYI